MGKYFNDDDGVWRTILGRKVFIRDGESLTSALKNSRKFKNKTNKPKKLNDYVDKLKDEYKNKKTIRDDWFDSYDYGKRIKKPKTELEKLSVERKKTKDSLVRANTKRQEIYENAMSDEAHEDYYGEEPKRNAKNTLSKEDYKKYERLSKKYHEGEKKHADILDKIEQYKKDNPKEYSETALKANRMWHNENEEKRQGNMDSILRRKAYQKYMHEVKGVDISPKDYEKLHKKFKDTNEYTKKEETEQRSLDTLLHGNKKSRELWYEHSLNEIDKDISKKARDKVKKGVKTLSGDYERDNKGKIVSQKEYDDFREAYKKDLISKEDYRNDNYDALKEIKKQNESSKNYTGYQQYLRDRYGTENEDIVSAGNKSKSKLYQEYKDETIRRVNRERMTPGVTNIETAYKRAFEKYKKEHPNTKLNFQEFKKMTEE